MSRRKGELTPAELDRRFSHQVAVAAAHCKGRNHVAIHDFCREMTLASRGHTVWRDDVGYLVFCFADKSHAVSLA